MKDVYAYKFGDNLYINLTNQCSNDCTFCLRRRGVGIGEDSLWLSVEPSFEDVIKSIEERDGFDEVVFCGYGESTYRLDVLLKVADYLKKRGYKTRLDTNGLGSVINGFDISTRLVGLIDVVSVSLNQSDAEKYNQISQPIFENAYEQMLDFSRKCVQNGIDVLMTVVDVIGEEDIVKCRIIADDIGARFRVRELIL